MMPAVEPRQIARTQEVSLSNRSSYRYSEPLPDAGQDDHRLLTAFQRALHEDGHFCGRQDVVHAQVRNGILRITGALPTYFLKQLVQSIARRVSGIKRIVNCISVFEPNCDRSLDPVWRERI